MENVRRIRQHDITARDFLPGVRKAATWIAAFANLENEDMNT
jgi:hypothetical protein